MTQVAEPRTLIDRYLDEQRQLSAVEMFSNWHDDQPAQARYYSSLLPASPPGEGEQYAFEVDLDRCSGCKACVTACHALNGLDDTETWREVGLLVGGTDSLPVIQHVTAACHHCLDPACLNVCPVNAYVKHDVTGIVKHLDDQCIGCQYCTLACPYDVPKYHKSKGIVRKCDMCSDRLTDGEAPACVQACPHEAIRIAIVNRQEVRDNCEMSAFLPGAPEPGYTLPTTNYKTNRVLPRNLLPADYYSVKPEHAHLPLVFMLVLTQLSVGAFVIELALRAFGAGSALAEIRPLQATSALLCGLLALAASTFHLGRPLLAYRAVIGLRRSWLSREILAFGLFSLFASAYAMVVWRAGGVSPRIVEQMVAAFPNQGADAPRSPNLATTLALLVVATGLAGVVCSIMIYQCTSRSYWTGSNTIVKFLSTTLILGLTTALVTALAGAGWSDQLTIRDVFSQFGGTLCLALAVTTSAKLLFEAAFLRHVRDKLNTPAKRSVMLLTGELARVTKSRFACGVIGGVLLPALIVLDTASSTPVGISDAVLTTLVGSSFLLLLAGELCERYLFFTAVVSPRMPGGLRT